MFEILLSEEVLDVRGMGWNDGSLLCLCLVYLINKIETIKSVILCCCPQTTRPVAFLARTDGLNS